MDTRVLERRLRSPTLAFALAALVSGPACITERTSVDGSEELPGDDENTVDLGVSSTIIDLAAFGNSRMAVSADRDVVLFDNIDIEPAPTPEAGVLRAGTLNKYGQVLVGEGGLLLRRYYGQEDWTLVESGLVDDLIAVATITLNEDMIALASGRALLSLDGGYSWSEMPAPEGGWGELRGVFSVQSQPWIYGAGGVLWSGDDLGQTWTRHDVGSDADFVAGGLLGARITVAAVDRVFVQDPGGTWTELPALFEGEIVDLSAGFVVTSIGEVHELSSDGSSALVEVLDFTPTQIVGDKWSGLHVGGEDGRVVRISLP